MGVETTAVRREPPPTRTTLAFVEVSKDGNREFTFYRSVPAADELLAPEDIRRESLAGLRSRTSAASPSSRTRHARPRASLQLAIDMDVPVAVDVNPARTSLEQPRRIPSCSSGKRTQHRLTDSGDGQLNHALHIIVTRAQQAPQF